MPHPERAVDPLLGPTDGMGLFRSVAAHLARVWSGSASRAMTGGWKRGNNGPEFAFADSHGGIAAKW